MKKTVDGIEVTFTPGYSQWDVDDDTWHINWSLGEKVGKNEVYHVTKEGIPKKHFFFTMDAYVISDASATKQFAGPTSYSFSKLPDGVKNYITKNISQLIS